MSTINALTLDLDDTLWAIEPVIHAANQAVHKFMEQEFPGAASRFDAGDIVDLRQRAAIDHPHLAHDFTAMRRLTYAEVLSRSGYPRAEADRLLEHFLHHRHQVTLFDDVVPSLRRISNQVPVIALSNGNADVYRIGLDEFFTDSVSAIRAGRGKPHADIYMLASRLAGAEPANILHVGDNAHEDIQGASACGFLTAWVNRFDRAWQIDHQPDFSVTDLAEVADIVERHRGQ